MSSGHNLEVGLALAQLTALPRARRVAHHACVMFSRSVLVALLLGLVPGCGEAEEPSSTPPATGGTASGGSTHSASGGTSNGSGGLGGSAATEPTAIERQGGHVSVSVGALVMTIDADRGARVLRFARDGQDVLLSSEVESHLYGSTFWTSPQADWNWPPIAAFDEDAYEVEIADEAAVFRSGPSNLLDVRVEKRFEPLAESRAIRVSYAIVNVSDDAVSYAPWEVTRVPAGGLTFFAEGNTVLDTSNLDVTSQNGHIWYASPAEPLDSSQKLFADGRGWLAHVHEGQLLVKSHPDIAPGDFAPDHAEIEVYADPTGTYVELERQGRYASIAPGTRLEWSVVWRLEALEEGVAASVGNAELLQAAQALRE